MNYQVGEKILCYHGPHMYEAKILKAEIWTGQDPSEGGFKGPHYRIHYQGWKATWDEWVPESRMLKLNEENLAKQDALFQAARVAAAGKKKDKDSSVGAASSSSPALGGGPSSAGGSRKRPRESDEKRRSVTADGGGPAGASSSTAPAATGSGGGGSAPKRSRDALAADDEDYTRGPEIKLVIPDALKVQLVDDWENITKHELLVPLPRRPNVRDVLAMYREHVLRKKKEAQQGGAGGGGSLAASHGPQHGSSLQQQAQAQQKSRIAATPIPVLDQIIAGLTLYFDKALGQNLLYRFERTQYLQIRKASATSAASGADASTSTPTGTGTGTPTRRTKREVSSSGDAPDADTAQSGTGTGTGGTRPPSEIYGAEHFLRLFVNLPAIIAHTTLDSESVGILRDHLEEILGMLVAERERGASAASAAAREGGGMGGPLFVKYEASSPAYQRLSQV